MCVKCQPDGELPEGRKASEKFQCLRYRFCIPLLHMTDIDYEISCKIPAMRSFKDYCKGGIFMLCKKLFFTKKRGTNVFAQSYQELKKTKTLVVTALLIALGIVLGEFSVQITESMKIGISFIATQMTAMLFGPVVGGIMGGVADILKFIIKPTGPFLIGYTLSAILGPVIYGVMLYKKPITLWRILLSKTVVAVFINLLLGTYWSHLYFGAAFWASIPAKLIQQVIQVPIQSLIFYFVMITLKKAKVFQILAE